MADELTPGFHQGHLRGRASGRLSPREAIRGPRREQVYASHGLMSQGEADPNQGQLFSLAQAGVPTRTPASVAREYGVAPPLASNQGGFMPGIQRSTPQATRKAKVTAINALAAARTRTGADRGTGAPVREAMEDRAAVYSRGQAADWYRPVSEGRNVPGEGMAHQYIAEAAHRTDTTHAQMTRAVALTSPRTAWDEGGAPGTTDYVRPNIESAENVVRAVKSLPPDSDPAVIKEAASAAPGSALNSMKAKAGLYHATVPTSNPIGISDPSSQKVPNFEQALHSGHQSRAIRRGAAGAYTVDAWDTKSIGGDERMLKSDTGYAVAHMTGVRAALKAGELPSDFQASTWNVMRNAEQPASMGTNRLFVTKRSGKVLPNPDALATPTPQWTHDPRSQRRQSFAEKYDLEF